MQLEKTYSHRTFFHKLLMQPKNNSDQAKWKRIVLKRFSKRTWFVLWVFFVALIAVIATYAYMQRPSITREPITREEAIEISANSELVKEGLAISRSFTIETNYCNSSTVEQLKLGHSELYDKVPEGHSVWEVIWWLRYQAVPGGYNVIVIVDANTATIIHEEKGIILL